MSFTLSEEKRLQKAAELASLTGGAGVPSNQLAMVLSHLKRHRDLGATLALLAELPRSPFAARSGRTRGQFRDLEEHCRKVLAGLTDWQDAAWIVGWAKRLAGNYRARRDGGGPGRHRPPRR